MARCSQGALGSPVYAGNRRILSSRLSCRGTGSSLSARPPPRLPPPPEACSPLAPILTFQPLWRWNKAAVLLYRFPRLLSGCLQPILPLLKFLPLSSVPFLVQLVCGVLRLRLDWRAACIPAPPLLLACCLSFLYYSFYFVSVWLTCCCFSHDHWLLLSLIGLLNNPHKRECAGLSRPGVSRRNLPTLEPFSCLIGAEWTLLSSKPLCM